MLKQKQTGSLQVKKELRTGFTTGACAAAASKAAAIVLSTGEKVDSVEITLPAGKRVFFKINHCQFKDKAATCSVIKDAGDDPDVTHGAEICSTASWIELPGIEIDGGEGVGKVTRPGLGLEIGSPAINPVPRRMITEAVGEVIANTPERQGVRVIISVPKGLELATKTLNPRLGIFGGISILGTSGLVIPYSTVAFKACISKAIDVAIASGNSHLALTTGGRSEAFAQRYISLPEVAFIQMGDWVGFALKACARKGVSKVTLCGMIGKLSKIASGHFQTHVSRSKTDMKFLASVASSIGTSSEVIYNISRANTVRHIYEIVPANVATKLFNEICRLAAQQSWELVNGTMAIEYLMTDFEGKRLLGRASLDGKENQLK